jgi:hypothetical protein
MFSIRIRRYNFILIFLCYTNIYAQDSIPETFLEAVVIKAERNLDANYFINQTLQDKTFYKAFKNLRKTQFHAENDIQFYNDKNNILASYKSQTIQVINKNCTILEEKNKQHTGNFYTSNGNYNYYTMQVFAQHFFRFDTICNVQFNDTTTQFIQDEMQNREVQMRTLIFNPGKKLNIPIIGHKMAIFSKAMIPYYNYSIQSTFYNGVPAYLFEVTIKPEWNYTEYNDKTVIKSFKTYFNKQSKQVLARKYNMEYHHWLFDFDINMEIELQEKNNVFMPKKIKYNGQWDIPFKKKEIAIFNIQFK